VRITVHQFRHLAGYLYLRQVPGGHETIRALLGHKSIETTIRFYAGMETAAAARAYDAAVLSARP
jgi:integrase